MSDNVIPIDTATSPKLTDRTVVIPDVAGEEAEKTPEQLEAERLEAEFDIESQPIEDVFAKTDLGKKLAKLKAKAGKSTSKLSDEQELKNAMMFNKWTERGFANRAVAFFKYRVRFQPDMPLWAAYEGKRWMLSKESNRTGQFFKEMHEYMRNVIIPEIPDPKARKSLEDYLNSHWDTSGKQGSITTLLKGDKGIWAEKITEFNKDGHLFNVQNGTINLRTGKLKTHDPKDMITQIAPITYEEIPEILNGSIDEVRDKLSESRFWKLILRAFDGHEETAEHLMGELGMALSVQTKKRKFGVVWGATDTGKSIIFSVMLALMGSTDTGGYFMSGSPPDWAKGKKDGDKLSKIAGMTFGARILFISELMIGMVLDASMIKSYTGGDSMPARILYSNPRNYGPECSIFYTANNPPHMSELTDALGNRLQMFHTPTSVPVEEQIKELDKLIAQEEASLTMNLLIRYAIALDQGEITPSQQVREQSDAHMFDDSPVGRFLALNLFWDKHGFCETQKMYDTYLHVAKRENTKFTMEYTAFSMAIADIMKKNGIEKKKRSGNRNGYLGVGIVTAEDFVDPRTGLNVANPHYTPGTSWTKLKTDNYVFPAYHLYDEYETKDEKKKKKEHHSVGY